MGRWMGGGMDGWMKRWRNGWMDGWVEARMDRWVGRRMDEEWINAVLLHMPPTSQSFYLASHDFKLLI